MYPIRFVQDCLRFREEIIWLKIISVSKIMGKRKTWFVNVKMEWRDVVHQTCNTILKCNIELERRVWCYTEVEYFTI